MRRMAMVVLAVLVALVVNACVSVRRLPSDSPDCKWSCHAPYGYCCNVMNASCCDW
jgi:hypothetical protein